ncbi:hypothetical protein DBB34_05460 [Sphaerisporangium cinnabarinum]|nr:hypothetical protein [Sphaerisporangium cinnabarinum]PTU57195.1 hypothetical protein DBB34_05460 [Sphaerisporangium cinnabarinum]
MTAETTSTDTAATTAQDVQGTQATAQDANGTQDAQTSTGDVNGAQNAASAAETETSPWDDPAKAKAEIERLRRENASARTTAKQTAADEARTALVQDLGKALGLVKDGDTAPTPEQLTEQATAARDEARVARVELAVYQRATAHQGDPAALLDSRAFLAKVADLDPTADDFGDKVDTAIKAAIDTNPKLKAAPVQASGPSSVDHAGGTGEGAVTTEQFAAMSPAEKNALYVKNPTLYRQLTGRE